MSIAIDESMERRARKRSFLQLLVREPLVHFFLVGALVFAAGFWHQSQTDSFRIVVGPERMAKIGQDYALQFGHAPAGRERALLIDRYIDDEVLFREGLALGLDKGDEIVRRRIVQKTQFLLQNMVAPAEPTDAQLTAYFRANSVNYVAPAVVTFTHIYFSPDRDGEAAARARALKTLATLSTAIRRAPERGDAFADLYDYAGFTHDQAVRLFGNSELAEALFQAPLGRWSGPFRSGYGWHLVLVEARDPAKLAALSRARDTVRADYLAHELDRANAEAFAATKARYTIVREDLQQR